MKIKPNYIVIPLIVIAVALVGSALTSSGMDWYGGIIKPELTPPKWVFPIAWNLIFIATAASAIIFWNKATELKVLWFHFHKRLNDKNLWITILFLANAILNILWSYLFFSQQLVLWAFVEMIFLEATIIALIVMLRPTSRLSAYLLLPYAIWVGFATYLTYMIHTVNLM